MHSAKTITYWRPAQVSWTSAQPLISLNALAALAALASLAALAF
jgi:hypothetical protein